MFGAPGGLGSPPPSQPNYGDNSFGTPAPANGAYGGQQTYPAQQQAFAQPPTGTAPLYNQQQSSAPFGSPEPPPSSVPVSAPIYTPATPTSSLGFASPNDYAYPGQANGMSHQATEDATQPPPLEADQAANGPAANTQSDPALFSMNVLSGQQPALVSEGTTSNGGTMADQAYAKLVNMDAFDLVKGAEQARNNPFEAANNNAMNQVSLADMKSKNGNVRIFVDSFCLAV